jgi:hypothetical protein
MICWKNIRNKFFSGSSAGWTAIFTCVLAIFTGVLVVFTCKLASVADRADKNFVSTQRAFVNFDGIIDKKVMTADGKSIKAINFFISWMNSGTTPTRTATSQVNMQVWRSELPKGFDFADLPGIKRKAFVFGPKATFFQKIEIPIDIIKDIREGKSHLYFWGELVYQDIFPGTPQRLTEFCVELTDMVSTKPDVTDPSAEFAWAPTPCGKHYCYDEDCPDYKSRIK